MKKLMILTALVASVACAKADVTWSWFMDKTSANTELSFGIASKCASVETLELSLIYGGSPIERGVQWTIFGINNSKSAELLQVAPWFNRGDESCVQLAFVNVAKKNVFNLGFINITDSSKVQLGFLNFNKNGFLPIFPFINLDKSLFD